MQVELSSLKSSYSPGGKWIKYNAEAESIPDKNLPLIIKRH